MKIVFSTVDTAEQEVGRAECTEAIGDDYANGAAGRAALLYLFEFTTFQYYALKYEKLKDTISNPPAVYHTARYGKRLSFCTACGATIDVNYSSKSTKSKLIFYF